jgi:hypothetical protein
MAYNEETADRIRAILSDLTNQVTEKKMFSGICFMVDEKMCCATHTDKKTNEELLLCRIGEAAYETAIERDECIPMAFTGKPMKGYLYVLESGFRQDADLTYWLKLCLDFNPQARKSKK